MNQSNRSTEQNKNEITNKNNQNNTTKATSNLPSSPTLWKQNQYDLGIWSKTKFNLYINQFPLLMVDKIPQTTNIPPREINFQPKQLSPTLQEKHNIE